MAVDGLMSVANGCRTHLSWGFVLRRIGRLSRPEFLSVVLDGLLSDGGFGRLNFASIHWAHGRLVHLIADHLCALVRGRRATVGRGRAHEDRHSRTSNIGGKN